MLRPGKLDPQLLEELLSSNVIRDERVVIRPAVGEDVCAIRFGDRCLVVKTDPITFATDSIGWYVVQVNANDLATVGARPRWFLVTVLLPEGRTDEALVRRIWDDLQGALESIGCALCGGHTEVTVGLDRPLLVGQMLGEVALNRLINKSSVRAGDRVLLTKGVPVEGTAIMARERRGELLARFPAEVVERGARFLYEPGIGVLAEAMAACEAGGVHAMHDPTEGGVATGLWELARATGLGLRADAARIPVLEPGRSFCAHFGMDPLGVIASGALLVCVEPSRADAVRRAVEACGVECVEVGQMCPPEDGVTLVRDGRAGPMPVFAQDEITRLWTQGG
jgi:hydrogenase expression/formation protein HypE